MPESYGELKKIVPGAFVAKSQASWLAFYDKAIYLCAYRAQDSFKCTVTGLPLYTDVDFAYVIKSGVGGLQVTSKKTGALAVEHAGHVGVQFGVALFKASAELSDQLDHPSLASSTSAVATPMLEPICTEGDPAESCIVSSDPGGGGGGGGGGEGSGTGSGGGATGQVDLSGAGGNAGNSANGLTPAQCKLRVCDAANNVMTNLCQTEKNPGYRAQCYGKANEYYGNCLRSCDTNDWSWLSPYNYIYR